MTLFITTTYAFDIITEKESIDDFERNHDMAEWHKSISTQSAAFTRKEIFMTEAQKDNSK